jgi:hypothetical protein
MSKQEWSQTILLILYLVWYHFHAETAQALGLIAIVYSLAKIADALKKAAE